MATAVTRLGPHGVEDMISIDNLEKESMLENLRLRYNANLIYTYTGTILVSVNPFKPLPIYTNDIVQKYIGQRIGALPPHLFAIADTAYRSMKEFNKSQSIIVSGESGAGKTEAAKLMLQFLAAISKQRSQVEQSILQTSPIMEAFGNARTVRNNNSSRFGKLIEIGFDPNGLINGARITQYLLEKSRVVFTSQGERNYHIFYQALAGFTDDERKRYLLGNKGPDDFRYTNQSGCTSIPGWDEDALFNKTRDALSYLNVSDKDQDQIFALLSAVLWLGNIEFAADGEGSKMKPGDAATNCAKLLGVTTDSLAKALVNRSISIRGTTTTIPLRPAEAVETRDALAKALYSKNFSWLTVQINKAIQKATPKHFIAVLDIFGFENFKVNSFEQMCINYTNEKLQLQFNDAIFRQEQIEYDKEKINWSKVSFKDNMMCIALIEATKPPGILSLLDEETRFPKATDLTFLDKITEAFQKKEKNEYFDRGRTDRDGFVIKHYAGDVRYAVKDFLDKNRDTLQMDLLQCVLSSTSPLIKALFAETVDESQAKKAPTVGGFFRSQLVTLVNTLGQTQISYVRTIKPNMAQTADNFDAEMVMAQLSYAGMLETVRIRKSGYPCRFVHVDFCRRYGLLSPKVKGTDKAAAQQICSDMKINPDFWQVGLTKVFMRQDTYTEFEERRNQAVTKYAVRIQAWWRGMMTRLAYLEYRGGAIVIQAFWRMYRWRSRFVKQRRAAQVFQAAARMAVARSKSKARLEAMRARIAEEKRRREEEERKRREEEERKRREEEERAKKDKAFRQQLEERKKEEERKAKEAERAKQEAEKKAKQEAEAREKMEKMLLKEDPSGQRLEQYRQQQDAIARGQTVAQAQADVLGLASGLPAISVTDDASAASASSHSNRMHRGPTQAAMSGLRDGGDAPDDEAAAAAAAGGSYSSAAVNKDKWKPYKQLDTLEDPPEMATEGDLNAYPFLEYAHANFRKENELPKAKGLMNTLQRQASGTLRRGKSSTGGTMTVRDQMGFQKKTLDYSLLPLDENASKGATECFALMNNWIQGIPTNKKIQDPFFEISFVLKKGLSTPDLRDELYCQAIKQTIQCPKEYQTKAWMWLIYLCGTFLPTETLRKYALTYLYANSLRADDAEISTLAAFALRRLSRAIFRCTIRGIYRHFPPGALELSAIRSRAHMVLTVHVVGGKQYDVEIDSAAIANEVIGMVRQKIGLKDASYFSLYENWMQKSDPTQVLERSMPAIEYVADEVAKAEFAKDYQLRILFKRKIFINPSQLPDDPVEVDLLYAQCVEEIKTGVLPVSASEILSLAALRLQHESGDANSSGPLPTQVLELVPLALYSKRSDSEWRSLILSEWGQLAGTPRAEAKTRYLQFASGLMLYGATVVPIEGHSDPSLPPKFSVVVNVNGIHFLRDTDSGTPDLFQTYFFTEVQVEYTPTSVKMVTTVNGRTKAIELPTKKGIEIRNLYMDYSFWLEAQSEWCRAIEDYEVDDPMLLSFAANDIIHILDKEDPEWYRGEVNGRTGQFPSNKVAMLMRPPPNARGAAGAGHRAMAAHLLGGGASKAEPPGTVAKKFRASLVVSPGGGAGSTSGTPARSSARMSARLTAMGKPGGDAETRKAGLLSKYEVDPSQYPMDEYVLNHFRPEAGAGMDKTKTLAGDMAKTLKRGKTSKVKNWTPKFARSFTAQPIAHSLTVIENKQLDALASEVFRRLMQFMEDLPRGRTTTLMLVQFITRTALQNTLLRDEIFCQVMKQVTDNPRIESMGKGWALLGLLCGLFTPSTDLWKYLFGFLTSHTGLTGIYQEVSVIAQQSMEKLVKLRESGVPARKVPPSQNEIEAVLGGGQLSCIIYLSDKSMRIFDIDSITSVRDLTDQITDLGPLNGWTLFEVITAHNLWEQYPLKADDKICDVMANWESFELPPRLEGDVEFRLMMMKQTFLSSDVDISGAKTAPLIYGQLVVSVTRGYLGGDRELLCYLAAVQLQVELGDYTDKASAERLLEQNLGNYMPGFRSRKKLKPSADAQANAAGTMKTLSRAKQEDARAVIDKIVLCYAQLSGMSALAAQKQYIAKSAELPLYGSIFYLARWAMTRKNVRDVLVAINQTGLHLWELDRSALIKTIKFEDVASYGAKDGAVNIMSGNLISPISDTLLSDAAYDIAETFKAYQTARSQATLTRKQTIGAGRRLRL